VIARARSTFARPWLCAGLLALAAFPTGAEAQRPSAPAVAAPQQATASEPVQATLTGLVQDVDKAAVPNAHLTLEHNGTHATRAAESDAAGAFTFGNVIPGEYTLLVKAPGFAPWKVEDLVLVEGQSFALPEITLGVEALSSTVNAITQEDLAEQQITEEEHQRILGVLPNFYVSYLPNAAPLTRKQKFKLAIRVSTDPVTIFTTGVTAGIAQAQGDFAGYGPGIGGYGQRYAAIYGDRLGSTFFGAALFPSIFHQDPRYFYMGHGSVPHRALYAISTTVICRGDNGHWQPNYSNVFGNLAAAGLASSWYPPSSRHSVQVTVSDTLLNVATGAFGTLFQEFALRHFTRGGYSHRGE
jgi:hypothetical protein